MQMLDLKHLRSNTSRMSNIESNNSQKDTPSKSLKSFSVSEALVQFSSSTTTLRGQRKNFFSEASSMATAAALPPAPGRPSSTGCLILKRKILNGSEGLKVQ